MPSPPNYNQGTVADVTVEPASLSNTSTIPPEGIGVVKVREVKAFETAVENPGTNTMNPFDWD
ncbi:MAG: hypothetical protein HQM09_24485 [Candidatus Riflebacteria bacterium]|nr:hypothetical protein [Candidatus Riflebacteria bacterium]